jgi:hypothetical protein
MRSSKAPTFSCVFEGHLSRDTHVVGGGAMRQNRRQLRMMQRARLSYGTQNAIHQTNFNDMTHNSTRTLKHLNINFHFRGRQHIIPIRHLVGFRHMYTGALVSSSRQEAAYNGGATSVLERRNWPRSTTIPKRCVESEHDISDDL